MDRLVTALAVTAVLWTLGCTPAPGPAPIAPKPPDPARLTHVRVRVTDLGTVPNSGLLLPAVSPDGKWVAALHCRSGLPTSPDVLFTGKGALDLSLQLRPTQDGAKQPRVVCLTGALWPAWSPDSRSLVFVVHEADGTWRLAVYDVAAGTTRRLSAGRKPLIMPAVSATGKKVAVIIAGRASEASRLHVMDLATGRLTPCPLAGQAAESHFQPQWTADGRIVFLVRRGGKTHLAHWQPGKFSPEALCPIGAGPSELAAMQCFAGLGRPISPNGKRLAYYDAAVDRIVLIDLADGGRTELRKGTRAGCWLDAATFVAATGDQMLLYPLGGSSVRLMRGSWLPRAGLDTSQTLIVLTRGPHPRVFGLVKLQLLATN